VNDLNIQAVVKGKEHYILLYDEAHRQDALLVLGRWASHPELTFSWYDAACLSKRIRQVGDEFVELPAPEVARKKTWLEKFADAARSLIGGECEDG
jgi:hypothetical protein